MTTKYEPKESEPKWQKFWLENEVFKYKLDSDKPTYSIDTPPPTVSGRIHIGHIFSYTQAEVIARFKRMQGYNVFYPFGFDDNGLPTERLVEKEIGKKASDMPRKEFINTCLDITEKYRQEFKKLWQSVGISADWDLEYSTISEYSRKISQKSFLELYKKGFIIKKTAPALWDTEVQTSIAQAEIEDKEFDSFFHDLKFTLENGEDLVIATTRPELLPACTAVFVNPDDDRFKHLVGKNVTTPLGKTVKIMTDDKVAVDKGSGAVMCCTYGDETDLYWVKKYNLAETIIISPEGKIKNSPIEEMNGLYVNKARVLIVEKLKEMGAILNSKPIVHTVKVYERTGRPIEIIPVAQWFIKTLEMKEQLLENAEKINWYPEYMKKRYTEWVEGLKWDWCISRQRFFGVSIPAWHSKKTGEIIFPDESQLPVDPVFDKPNTLPEGHTYEDIEPDFDVLDTWATSSVTPQLNAHWGEDHPLAKTLIPMDLRPQAHDIIRTWALYTIIKSELHFNDIPWKNIMISGHVLFKKGEKISKSKAQKMMTPEEMIDKFSADAVRFWACRASLGKDVQLEENEIKNGIKLVTKLWNAVNFAFMNLTDYDMNTKLSADKLEMSDKWVLLRTQETALKMEEALNKFEFGTAMSEFEKYFWHDFCDFYLELVKDRIYKPEKYENGHNKKLSAQYALFVSLNSIIKLIAPYLPHITEELYQKYYKDLEKELSIHQTKFPTNLIEVPSNNTDIFKGIDFVLQTVEGVRKFKTDNKIRLGEEIADVKIKTNNADIELIKNFADDIQGISRSHKVSFEESENFETSFEALEKQEVV
ncbi:MAG: valine--tRNA ligase [Candidatus Sericytochromatia bacterium]